LASCKDVMVVNTTARFADISGITNNVLQGVPIGTVAGLHATTDGFVIGIYHQYAISDDAAHTIHSSGQLEHYKHHVDAGFA
jgi:hypothetical protein